MPGAGPGWRRRPYLPRRRGFGPKRQVSWVLGNWDNVFVTQAGGATRNLDLVDDADVTNYEDSPVPQRVIGNIILLNQQDTLPRVFMGIRRIDAPTAGVVVWNPSDATDAAADDWIWFDQVCLDPGSGSQYTENHMQKVSFDIRRKIRIDELQRLRLIITPSSEISSMCNIRVLVKH